MTLKLSATWPITPAVNYRPAMILLSVLAFCECVACLAVGVLA